MRNYGDFDSILDQCLSQLLAGKARVEDCLVSYPDLATELEPLLSAAEQLRTFPKPVLRAKTKAKIESRLLRQVLPRPWFRPFAWRRPGLRLGWRGTAVGPVAAILLLFLVTTVAYAAGGSLPGSPLYPVKQATEAAWLFVAPARLEPELHLRFANRRLVEAEVMAGRGRLEPTVLEALTEETEAALQAAETLSPGAALPFLVQLVESSVNQQQRLAALLPSAPAPAQEGLAAALHASGEQAEHARRLMAELEGAQPPGQTRTPQPPGQTRTPEPPGQSGVSEPPGQTRTPEPPGQTRSPEPPGQSGVSEPPGQTKTPEPPGQTRTPQPPGQDKVPPGLDQDREPKSHELEKEPKPAKEPKPTK
jgi:hypothetical protein